MGKIAFLLSFVRSISNGVKVSRVKVDPGGGANITPEHYASPGDDSFPLEGDYVLLVATPRTGNFSVAGYLDPLNIQTAQEGEKRLYSRDSSGAEIARVHLKNTGEVEVVNSNGFMRLLANGNVDLNGVIISPAGQITLPSGQSVIADSMVVNGNELDAHIHGGVETGGGVTGPNQ